MSPLLGDGWYVGGGVACVPRGGEVKLDGKSPIRAAVLAALIEASGHGWDVARRAHLRWVRHGVSMPNTSIRISNDC